MNDATKALRGVTIELLRRADLLDAAAVDHHQAVAHAHRLVLVVRDEDGGDLEQLLQPAHLLAHIVAELWRRGWTSGSSRSSTSGSMTSARHRDALLLSARKLSRQALRQRHRA